MFSLNLNQFDLQYFDFKAISQPQRTLLRGGENVERERGKGRNKEKRGCRKGIRFD